MWKSVLTLTCLSLLLALPALAGGVDQVLYGNEEIADGIPNEIPTNEDDLFKSHPNDGTNNDFPDDGDDDGSIPDSDDPLEPGDENAPVPEPATGILLGMGVLGLARFIRRRKSS